MTKTSFLEALREALMDRDVSGKVIEDTIKEYASMIDDALESGESIETFIKRMGSPEKVAKALAKQQQPPRNKFAALSPFIATIAFFLIGVIYQAWHPGWLVFLLIPIAGILTSKKIQWGGLLVFVILIVFILGGWQTNLYNPLWSLFLILIPFGGQKDLPSAKVQMIAKVYTVIAVAIYHVWVVYALFSRIGGVPDPWVLIWPLSILIPIVVYAFINGTIRISIGSFNNAKDKQFTIMGLSFAGFVTITYVTLGVIIPGFWHPGWLLFLLIPVVFILLGNKKFPLVPLSPFIAITLFILVGEYVSVPGQDTGYTLSWLFFLLIPITGILFSKGDAA
jgi:uncharacterized membrane protein